MASALRRADRAHTITRSDHARYLRTYRRARSTSGLLAGARRRELAYVVQSVERMALAGRLTPTRMPAMFLQARRNADYWPSRPFPASGDQVTFRGSELLFQYFPGRGLQFHPLSNFKKANNLHGACRRGGGDAKPVCGARPPGPKRGTPCRPGRLRHLLDELSRLAVQRGPGFVAWEYLFHFGGGSPPWMSGMAQATGIVAFGRAAQLLSRPDYTATAKAALGAFEAGPPAGVRTQGPLGGVHYLQYSFARRLYIFNAFFQSLIGLHDFGRLAGDVRATTLFRQAEPEAGREVAHSDVGDWSRYSFRGAESTALYHELLREVLQGMGRRLGAPYCDYAVRYRGYQTAPPALRFSGPPETVPKRLVRVRFTLSKLSLVELKIYKGRRLAFTRLATFRRGSRSFSWKPRSAGHYAVRLGAKELRTGRSLRGRVSGAIMVNRPG
ncbi:MAG: D-glucuronyl C5-epimerase family protein [Thermoleophilaceae bacterium]